ncbi:MAG: hypothetical protein JWM52_390 [Candidatus Saccharibacteria bacterium]|nr:hypothetical protein [Candidatus Saccharibacteria bacterium]
MSIEDGSSAKSDRIKPKVSIMPDGKLAVLQEGNADYFAQQEQERQSAIGDRHHFGPRDRGEVYRGVRDGEPLIDDEQKTDIIAAELEERALDDPDDESVKQMLDFIKSLHPREAHSQDLSIFGLGHKKLEDIREQISNRPMSLEDRRKLEAQAQNMQLALDYYGDKSQKISGEEMDARAQVQWTEGEIPHMTTVRLRNATREAASRVLDEHNVRVDRNRERKAS